MLSWVRYDCRATSIVGNTALQQSRQLLGTDPALRAVLIPNSNPFQFPAPLQAWNLQFSFSVPPLPKSPTWNFQEQVFYIFGQVCNGVVARRTSGAFDGISIMQVDSSFAGGL